MSAWAVGQKVIMRERSYRSSEREVEVQIARVGRKYVYVAKGYGEVAFEASTGIEKGNGGYLARIFTPEGLAEVKRREALSRRFGAATSGYNWHRNLTSDEMEQIATLVEAANARAAS